MARVIIILFILLAICGGFWNLMWFFSSSSLASGACNNEFNLFHEHFRCRQPYLALIGIVLSIAIGVVAIFLFKRKLKAK